MKSPIEFEHSGRLLNETHTAEFLGMSKAWLRKRRYLKQSPNAIYLGTAVRYKFETLEKFVESLTTRADQGGSK